MSLLQYGPAVDLGRDTVQCLRDKDYALIEDAKANVKQTLVKGLMNQVPPPEVRPIYSMIDVVLVVSDQRPCTLSILTISMG